MTMSSGVYDQVWATNKVNQWMNESIQCVCVCAYGAAFPKERKFIEPNEIQDSA